MNGPIGDLAMVLAVPDIAKERVPIPAPSISMEIRLPRKLRLKTAGRWKCASPESGLSGESARPNAESTGK